jgi:uncharacterized repeat protein (TIGR01451 family)
MISATLKKRTSIILLAPALTLLALSWLFMPPLAGAFDNTLVYPDFPWKGMKVQFTAKGNFLLRGHTDFDPLIYPQTLSNPVLNVIQRRDLNLCTAGTVHYLDLSGKVVLTIPGPAADFKDAYVDIGVYHYPPGDVDGEILHQFTKSLTNAEYQPIIEIPFNLSGNNSQGYPPGFSFILQVCRWQDPSHTTSGCHTLDLNAVDIVFSDDPQNCFRIGSVNPSLQQKNVDFDQPGIQVEFTTPVDQTSVNGDTFYVYYWNQLALKTKVNGSILFSQDNTRVYFQPAEPLLDGVNYFVEVWGRTDSETAGHPAWIKSATGADLKKGKIWDFWTMPDLTDKIVVVPVQSVEGTDLIKDKPTALRVFMRWNAKPHQVHPQYQLKTLDANVTIHWWENNKGGFDSWALTGKYGYSWKPVLGTPIRREYRIYIDDSESYNKSDKQWGKESVNYFGYTPREVGTVSFKAEVEPSGQKSSSPRVFISEETTRTIRDSKAYRYTFRAFDVGNWAATGLVTPCPTGVPGTCVNIQDLVTKNNRFMKDLYPLSPGNAVSGGNVSQMKLSPPPPAGAPYNTPTATPHSLSELVRRLNVLALAYGSDAYIGVVPRDWLGGCGWTYAEYFLIGLDFARHAILMGQNASNKPETPDTILAHEMGHILRDWDDYDDTQRAGEGFSVKDQRAWRNSAWSLPPNPLPIKNIMYEDVCGQSNDHYWLDRNHYVQLYENELAQWNTGPGPLQAGESMLLASGAISVDTDAVIRDPWYILEPGFWQTPTPGDYDLVFQDVSGSVLSRHPFTPSLPIAGRSHFVLKVPFPSSTVRIKINKSGQVIHEFTPSSQAPQLAVNAPAAGVVWSGIQNISWSVSDGDGDPISLIAALSTDGGANWNTLEIHLSGNSLEWDTRGVPNSTNAYLKIAASDGLRTTIQTVGPFTIQNLCRVTGYSPAPNQTGGSINAPLMVEFSEPIDPGTLTADTFFLQDNQGGKVPAAITYDASVHQAVLTPRSPLKFSSVYTLSATSAIHTPGGTTPDGLAKSWSFTTEPDIYPPKVLDYHPRPGAGGVSVSAALIWVRFDQPMNPATLNGQTVSLKTEQGAAVEGTIEYNPADYTMVFRPIANLAANTRYVVTLDPAIADSGGQTLGTPFSWAFKTGEAAQYSPWVRFTKNFRDYLWDQNGDGQWDFLVVEADLSILFPGTYRLEGWLLDKNGLAVAQAKIENVNLPAGLHTQAFYFSRQAIESHGGEGPYYFGDAVIQDVLYPASLDALTSPYQTLFTNYTADSELLLFAFPDPGVFNQPLTFYASIDNRGSSNSSGVVFSATLPPSVDFVSSVSGQGSCSHNGGTVTCSIGTLGSRQSNLVSIQVMPREKGWIQFQASVTSVQDSFVANNDRQLSLEIGAGNNILYLPLIVRP